MINKESTACGLLVMLCLSVNGPVAAAAPDAAALFGKHCASCHGADRLGAMGPALLPESLQRTPKDTAAELIAAGLPATQMPAFRETLKPEEIAALVEYIYTAPAIPPVWGEAEIRASRVVYKPESVEGNATTVKPVYTADPLNLFLVVEAGDHHVTVLDGDKLEPIFRFKSRYALHGGPKFSSDGRFVYFASRDGWISKFDLYRLETVAEVRAGLNTRNLAVSADDRYVLVGNYLPQDLVLLDARDLSLIKVIPVDDGLGKGSRVSAVYTAPPRAEFHRRAEGYQAGLGNQLRRPPAARLRRTGARLPPGRGTGGDRAAFPCGASHSMTTSMTSSSTRTTSI